MKQKRIRKSALLAQELADTASLVSAPVHACVTRVCNSTHGLVTRQVLIIPCRFQTGSAVISGHIKQPYYIIRVYVVCQKEPDEDGLSTGPYPTQTQVSLWQSPVQSIATPFTASAHTCRIPFEQCRVKIQVRYRTFHTARHLKDQVYAVFATSREKVS